VQNGSHLPRLAARLAPGGEAPRDRAAAERRGHPCRARQSGRQGQLRLAALRFVSHGNEAAMVQGLRTVQRALRGAPALEAIRVQDEAGGPDPLRQLASLPRPKRLHGKS